MEFLGILAIVLMIVVFAGLGRKKKEGKPVKVNL